MTTFHYELALLGLPVTVRAGSLESARRKLLRSYLRWLNITTPNYPLAPPIQLLSTDDHRVLHEVHDPRFATSSSHHPSP